MKRPIFYQIFCFLLLASPASHAQQLYPDFSGIAEQKKNPNQMPNKVMPVIGVWVWGKEDLLPDGYKKSIDQISGNSPFNMIVPFLRFPEQEVVDKVIYNQVKLAANYAAQKNVPLVPDLDVRSARRAFRNQHPDELQEMLRLKEIKLSDKDSSLVVIESQDLNDHYSGGDITHHVPLKGTLLRVFSYRISEGGIEENSIEDITQNSKVLYSSKDSVKVKLPALQNKTHASVLVSFTHLYPDIFSPHLMEFQRKVIEQYAGIPFAGVCKDEWGFPPYYPRFYNQGTNDYWYSKNREKAYAERTGGRELLADFLLMAKGIKGKEAERQLAINHFMDMSTQRNTALEDDFYKTVKGVFGPDAVVAVHATWWPFPDRNEYKKNGLDWWTAKRDWAQTDELVPYAVRTALSKKWGSPVWYNMYYQKPDLGTQMWSSALAGGRINYLRYHYLFDNELMLAENRIRLLNYISKTPLDTRVAVIFGHSNTMNWAGPDYEDVGMKLVDSLWHTGYPVDLIPTSEIKNGSLKVDASGTIHYGLQKYSAVVLYHPEFEEPSTVQFFSKVNNKKTAMFRVGNWTRDFNGNQVNGEKMLPASMNKVADTGEAYLKLVEVLKKRKVHPQFAATEILDNSIWNIRDFNHVSYAPPTTGTSRLIDGTIVKIAGTNDLSGDPIITDFKIDNKKISVDAIGVAAVRLDKKGKLNALAAGGLKHFKTGEVEINLDKRVDVALWVDKDGLWQGVIQAADDYAIPDALLKITTNWTQINAPVPPLELQKIN